MTRPTCLTCIYWEHKVNHAITDCFLIGQSGEITINLLNDPTVTFSGLKKWEVDQLNIGKTKVIVTRYHRKGYFWAFEVEPLGDTNGQK